MSNLGGSTGKPNDTAYSPTHALLKVSDETREELLAWARERARANASTFLRVLDRLDVDEESSTRQSRKRSRRRPILRIKPERREEFEELRRATQQFVLTQDEWLDEIPEDTQEEREDRWAQGPPLTTGEAAWVLNVHTNTVKLWVRNGRIHWSTKTLGGHFRFQRKEILELRRKMA